MSRNLLPSAKVITDYHREKLLAAIVLHRTLNLCYKYDTYRWLDQITADKPECEWRKQGGSEEYYRSGTLPPSISDIF